MLFAAVVAGLMFLAARLVLATRRRENVRRQLSPYLAEAELARTHHRTGVLPLDRLGVRAEALLTRIGSHEAVQLYIDRAGIDARAGAFVCLDTLTGFRRVRVSARCQRVRNGARWGASLLCGGTVAPLAHAGV